MHVFAALQQSSVATSTSANATILHLGMCAYVRPVIERVLGMYRSIYVHIMRKERVFRSAVMSPTRVAAFK